METTQFKRWYDEIDIHSKMMVKDLVIEISERSAALAYDLAIPNKKEDERISGSRAVVGTVRSEIYKRLIREISG
jgi:hypothetical protein